MINLKEILFVAAEHLLYVDYHLLALLNFVLIIVVDAGVWQINLVQS